MMDNGEEKSDSFFSLSLSLLLFCAELAASVPRTDVVGKSEYFRFGMRDSLAIEASFLQVLLLSS